MQGGAKKYILFLIESKLQEGKVLWSRSITIKFSFLFFSSISFLPYFTRSSKWPPHVFPPFYLVWSKSIKKTRDQTSHLTAKFPLYLMTAIKTAIFGLPNLCIFKKRPPSFKPLVIGFFACSQSMTAFLQRQHGTMI